MRLPCDIRHDHRQREVDDHTHQHRSKIGATFHKDHQQRCEQTEYRAGCPVCRHQPIPGHPAPQGECGGAAQSADQVERQILPMAEHPLQYRPYRPQRHHVERDMQEGWGMQKHRGQPSPRMLHCRDGHEHSLSQHRREQAGGRVLKQDLQQPHDDADHTNRRGDDRSSATPLSCHGPTIEGKAANSHGPTVTPAGALSAGIRPWQVDSCRSSTQSSQSRPYYGS